MFWKQWNNWRLVVVLAMPFSLAGCGESTATVSGKVSFQGNTLKGGSVIFVPQDGKPGASASIGEDGMYTMAKAPLGKVTVCVETRSLDPSRFSQIPKDFKIPGKNPNAPPDVDKMAKRFTSIPEKYADPKTSNLTYTVEAGQQKNDIDLK